MHDRELQFRGKRLAAQKGIYKDTMAPTNLISTLQVLHAQCAPTAKQFSRVYYFTGKSIQGLLIVCAI